MSCGDLSMYKRKHCDEMGTVGENLFILVMMANNKLQITW